MRMMKTTGDHIVSYQQEPLDIGSRIMKFEAGREHLVGCISNSACLCFLPSERLRSFAFIH